MVFVFVPPKKDGRKASKGETVRGLLIAALIALGFALFAALQGPKSGSPPPPIVLWALGGITGIVAIVAFFAWLRSESDADDSTQDGNSQEEL